MRNDFRHCPGCGEFVESNDSNVFPDVCPSCGWDGEFGTPAQYFRSDVYAHLDGTGGLLDTLANALHAADEAGFHVEADNDRRADIDAHLQQAFDMMDEEGDDVDPEEVFGLVEGAESAAYRLYAGMGDELENFTLPDYVDSGVYDTLGEYTEFVCKDLTGTATTAELWVEWAR